MNELLQNMSKIHTTVMGAERIKKNIDLEVNNIVEWCKKKVKKSDDIYRNGKNWYVNIDGVIITINAHSYTIITAHKKK